MVRNTHTSHHPGRTCPCAAPSVSQLGKLLLQGNFPLMNVSSEAEKGLTGRYMSTKHVQMTLVLWELGSWYAWGSGQLISDL